jgi:hypothetical protein
MALDPAWAGVLGAVFGGGVGAAGTAVVTQIQARSTENIARMTLEHEERRDAEREKIDKARVRWDHERAALLELGLIVALHDTDDVRPLLLAYQVDDPTLHRLVASPSSWHDATKRIGYLMRVEQGDRTADGHLS